MPPRKRKEQGGAAALRMQVRKLWVFVSAASCQVMIRDVMKTQRRHMISKDSAEQLRQTHVSAPLPRLPCS